MVSLSVSLLGQITVTLDGQPVDSFEYNKVRALLAYLIVENESPHRRDALAGTLWPDQSQRAALDSLRNALARLRQAIGDRDATPPYLIITSDTLQFNPSSSCWLDINQFNLLLDACQVHRHRRIECCVSCTSRLTQAAGLYRGPFLQSFSLPDSDLFEDWASRLRERLGCRAIEALQQLGSIHEWRGEVDPAFTFTRRLLELDPFDEPAHSRMMRLFATQGKRAEACVQYEKCRRLLKDELGVEPCDETTHLYEQVKYGLFHAAPSMQQQRINNLPPNPTSFVGRRRELDEINLLMDNPACRLLTLVGPGGVGKTRLAIAVARQQLEAFPYGACFVPLAGINSVESIVASILQALGLTQVEQGDLKLQLFDYLKDKELILVLDNFEHLLEGAGLVSELLQKAPGLMLLVTSRQRLDLQAEWLFEVNGLDYPSGVDTQNLAAYEAVQLFTARLHQVKPRTTLFDDDLSAISHICQLVEGLPLGIELAASAVIRQTIEQVAEAIEIGTEDLQVSYRDLPERHRSLRAVFEHSYQLLPGDEQSAFICLAVFRGGFTEEAAEQVAGATLEMLDSLVEHSLVRYDPEKNRYDLHELVRQYAQEKLNSMGRHASLRQQHLDYFTGLAEQVDNDWMEQHSNKVSLNNTQELNNFRAALERCFADDQLEQALQLAGALGKFWVMIGHQKEGLEWIVRAVGSSPTSHRDHRLGRALMWAGWFLKATNASESMKHYEEALSIWRELGDELRIAYTLSDIGRVWIDLDDFDNSRRLLEESLELYRKLDNQAFISRELILLCETYMCKDPQENLELVRKMLVQSQEINRCLGLDSLFAWANSILGQLEMNQGNFNLARSLFEEGSGKTADNYLLMCIYNLLGLTYYYMGDRRNADSSFEKGLQVAKNNDFLYHPLLCHFSYLLCQKGEFEKAMYFLKEMFRDLRPDPNFHIIIYDGCLEHLSGVFTACGELELAARMFAFAEAQREKLNTSMLTYIRPDYEHDLAETRRKLGGAEFNIAWEEGRAMTFDQIKACALEARVRLNEPAILPTSR